MGASVNKHKKTWVCTREIAMSNDITAAHDEETRESAEQSQKIRSLREMINNAERTIQGAKAMLLQLEGKKKTGRPRKLDDENGTVVEGTFDGQIMFGSDGKQYPVPANYASKSKLVEGDMLKLTITSDGSFVYKQIGPIERRHIIGIITQDDKGNYYIVTEGTPYRVLLASITYFKAEPGDEVAALIPRDMPSSFAALESVLQKGRYAENLPTAKVSTDATFSNWKTNLKSSLQTPHEEVDAEPSSRFSHPDSKTPKDPTILDDWVHAMKKEETGSVTPAPDLTATPAATTASGSDLSFLDEWVRDMESVEKELKEKEAVAKE